MLNVPVLFHFFNFLIFYYYFLKNILLTDSVYIMFVADLQIISIFKRLRWSRGSVLAFSTQVRGFLRAKKILSTPSFGGEVKPSVPCRRFVACKRSLMA
jgi:hypothetical protein